MQENVEKWVEALESGEFEQTQVSLKDEDGYCCLGVACDIYRRETGDGEWVWDEDFNSYAFVTEEDRPNAAVLPESVRKWLGASSAAVRIGSWSAIDMNDELGYDFKGIAARVREEGIK